MKISEVITALKRIQKEHGDFTCADDTKELPVGFQAIWYVEAQVVPPFRALRSAGVTDGETVALIRGQ